MILNYLKRKFDYLLLGINPIKSNWGIGFAPIENANSSITFNTTVSSFQICNNCYNDGSNWKYKANGKAAMILLYDGAIQIRTAGTGTAGNTITWTTHENWAS